MATFFKGAFYDEINNTLEATWLAEVLDANNVVTGYIPVKCRNYSSTQKVDFITDTGLAGQKYVTMAGW